MDPTTPVENDVKDSVDLALREFKMSLEEDLKESIPFYDNNANNTNPLSACLLAENPDEQSTRGSMVQPRMWKTEEDNGYLNEDLMGSPYQGPDTRTCSESDLGKSNNMNFYSNSETITGVRGDAGGGIGGGSGGGGGIDTFNASSPLSVCYSDDSIPELKYVPNEIPMQPPSSMPTTPTNLPTNLQGNVAAAAALHYPQHHHAAHPQHPSHPAHPQQQSQQSQQLPGRMQPLLNQSSHPNPFAMPLHRYPAIIPDRVPPQYSYQPHLHPHLSPHPQHPHLPHQHQQQQQQGNPATPFGPPPQHTPGFYPNMWYPNAPYGSSSNYYHPYGHRGYGPPPPHHPYPGYPHDPMLEMLQLSNSGREARNRAEKNRRDKLNGSIQTLSTIVPHVAESPRRVDKTAVLRFAAHGLRVLHVFGKTKNEENPEMTDRLMKLLDSFFLTLTCNGQIVLISNSIEQHLGHCQTDLYGQNILQITHPDDHAIIKQQLIPADLENLFDIQSDDENGEPRPRTQAEEDYIDKRLLEDKRSFTIRLARAGPRSEPTSYEIVKIDGCFRRSDCAPRGVKTSTYVSSLQLIRRTRGREDSIPLHTVNGNDIVLVAIARIIKPPKIIHRNFESNFLEYKTRHLIDGRIIDCDQRISLVAGYMRDEVKNLSPFTFIHQDDVRWVIVALRQMYDCNSSFGESTYRLYTRNRSFIYLHTKGYLEIDQNNKVHSFVCINTLLDEEAGKHKVEEMKKKFSVIIKTSIPQSTNDAPAAENPHQLEKAVLCLIQNLQKNSSDEDEPGSSYQNVNPNVTPSHTPSHQRGSSKTPPLALVPPEASTIKSSISQSLKIVNITPTPKQEKSQTDEQSEEVLGENSINDDKFLKRLSSSEPDANDDEIIVAKKRFKSAEIENVLTNSLDQIERTLNRQWNVVNELRDCGNKFLIPNTNERIDEIMEEHQEQSEMYLNIKTEYEVQRQSNKLNSTKSDNGDKLSTEELSPN